MKTRVIKQKEIIKEKKQWYYYSINAHKNTIYGEWYDSPIKENGYGRYLTIEHAKIALEKQIKKADFAYKNEIKRYQRWLNRLSKPLKIKENK